MDWPCPWTAPVGRGESGLKPATLIWGGMKDMGLEGSAGPKGGYILKMLIRFFGNGRPGPQQPPRRRIRAGCRFPISHFHFHIGPPGTARGFPTKGRVAKAKP